MPGSENKVFLSIEVKDDGSVGIIQVDENAKELIKTIEKLSDTIKKLNDDNISLLKKLENIEKQAKQTASVFEKDLQRALEGNEQAYLDAGTAADMELIKKLEEAEKQAKKTAFSFENLKKSIIEIAAGYYVFERLIRLVDRVYNKFKELGELAMVQEQMHKSLEIIMKANDRYSQSLYQSYIRQAEALQNLLGIRDVEIEKGIKLLQIYGNITNDLMPRTIQVMLNLATLMDRDVNRAAIEIGKASEGMVEGLRRMGITVDKTTFEAKGFSGILDILEKKLEGHAESLAQGAGKWQILGVKIEEVKEKTGTLLLKFFDGIGIIDDFSKAIDNLNKVLEKHIENKEKTDIWDWLEITASPLIALYQAMKASGLETITEKILKDIPQTWPDIINYTSEDKLSPLDPIYQQKRIDLQQKIKDLTTSEYEKELEKINKEYKDHVDIVGKSTEATNFLTLSVAALKEKYKDLFFEGMYDPTGKLKKNYEEWTKINKEINQISDTLLKWKPSEKSLLSIEEIITPTNEVKRDLDRQIKEWGTLPDLKIKIPFELEIKPPDYDPEDNIAYNKLRKSLQDDYIQSTLEGYDLELNALRNYYDKRKDEIESTIGDQTKLLEILELTYSAKLKTLAEKNTETWIGQAKFMESAFSDSMKDALLNGENLWESFFNKLKNMWVDTISDMAAKQIFKPIQDQMYKTFETSSIMNYPIYSYGGENRPSQSFMGPSQQQSSFTSGQLFSTAMMGYGSYQQYKQGNIDIMSGAMTGASIGGQTGSGWGAVIGAIIGGVAGGVLKNAYEKGEKSLTPRINTIWETIGSQVDMLNAGWRNISAGKADEIIELYRKLLKDQSSFFANLSLISGSALLANTFKFQGFNQQELSAKNIFMNVLSQFSDTKDLFKNTEIENRLQEIWKSMRQYEFALTIPDTKRRGTFTGGMLPSYEKAFTKEDPLSFIKSEFVKNYMETVKLVGEYTPKDYQDIINNIEKQVSTNIDMILSAFANSSMTSLQELYDQMQEIILPFQENIAQMVGAGFLESLETSDYQTFTNSLKLNLKNNISSSISNMFSSLITPQITGVLLPAFQMSHAYLNEIGSSEKTIGKYQVEAAFDQAINDFDKIINDPHTIEIWNRFSDIMGRLNSTLNINTEAINQNTDSIMNQVNSYLVHLAGMSEGPISTAYFEAQRSKLWQESLSDSTKFSAYSSFMTSGMLDLIKGVSDDFDTWLIAEQKAVQDIPWVVEANKLEIAINNVAPPIVEAINNLPDSIHPIVINAPIVDPEKIYIDGYSSSITDIPDTLSNFFKNINVGDWWNKITDFSLPHFASGGLTDGSGIAGEIGQEWIIPTYEPQKSRFLQDVGMPTSQEIKQTIVSAINSNLNQNENNTPIHITVVMGDKVIEDVMIDSMDNRNVVHKLRRRGH